MRRYVLKTCVVGLLSILVLAAFPALAQERYIHQGPNLREPGVVKPLSEAQKGAPVEIASRFVQAHQSELGLTASDLEEAIVTDSYSTAVSGLSHVYMQQVWREIPVERAILNISLAADGRVLNLGNRWLPNLSASANGSAPTISASDATERAITDLGLELSNPLQVLHAKTEGTRDAMLSSGGVSASEIPVRLVWLPMASHDLRLAWKVDLDIVATSNLWQIFVDAHSGEILDKVDLVVHDRWGSPRPAADAQGARSQGARSSEPRRSLPLQAPSSDKGSGDGSAYAAFEIPAEYPYENNDPTDPGDDVSLADPEGGRVVVIEPADGSASPFGWHDTDGMAGAEFTIPQGNNVHAYLDRDANNVPDAGEPNGGAGLQFTGALVPLDLINDPPTAYGAASAVNLFYWNNIIHDVFHGYGFNEAAGNFQENNYGNGGVGSDSVNAEAQDGGGTNNANFATPADGSNPRMQMFTWTSTTPNRDGDFSSGIIAHEYGHGISNRLTGGPSNVGCLNNSEQMGEGWSDWLGLVLTAHTGDSGTTIRGLGTYALGQPPDTGAGIRPSPYSTDFATNGFTYGDSSSQSVPHGVGFVWSTIIWEAYWDLVNEHGFNQDFYGDWTTGGNNLAIQLIMDGMKLQPCSPGFVDGRDAILLADQNLTGGANECLLWKAFARRGLGIGASQGSSGTNGDNSEDFNFPAACDFLGTTPSSIEICAGDDAIFEVAVGTAFSPPVTLSTVGAPAGTTSMFDTNPVLTLPGMSNLTLGSTGGLTFGTYGFDVHGDDTSTTFDSPVELVVFDASPGAVVLTSPTDGQTNLPFNPTLSWAAAPNGGTYTVEIATDMAFTNIVESASGLLTNSYAVQLGLDSATTYYWRVGVSNACGTEPTTAPFSFLTTTGPGDCDIGVAATVGYEDDFESGASGWTSSAGVGVNTWALASDRVHSGASAFHAQDVADVSDQYLVSPQITLPSSGFPLTLRFWNYQEIEDSGTGCFDAAVVEVSDNGVDWTRLEAELLTDPYDGVVSSTFSNPIAGSNAWCGDPQDWLQSIVDIDAWAGATVQFRFRLATDVSVDHPGWWIDDVAVQSCLGPSIFSDDFESGDLSAWSSSTP